MPVSMAFSEVGSGEPIVIVHGLFGSGRNWQATARDLARDGYRVMTVDLRNHGRSPWTPTMRLAELADDLAAFLDERGLVDATVLGHSVGGKAAMLMALAHPERVQALIVVDIAPVRYAHSFLGHVEAMQAVDLSALERRAEVADRLQPAIPDAPTRQFLVQNLVRRHGRLAWRLNLEAIAAAMPDLTGFPDPPAGTLGERYDGRVLMIRGAESDYIAPEHQSAIFHLFPQAEFAVIPGAGHRPHVEQPKAFRERVRTFLESGYA
ncbi:MAG: alpha/beta fold hydrolase [Rhodospirillales bacterium]|nr:MAG: alpha/beta fold hydrolase [Rhodospirillales bacterium]